MHFPDALHFYDTSAHSVQLSTIIFAQELVGRFSLHSQPWLHYSNVPMASTIYHVSRYFRETQLRSVIEVFEGGCEAYLKTAKLDWKELFFPQQRQIFRLNASVNGHSHVYRCMTDTELTPIVLRGCYDMWKCSLVCQFTLDIYNSSFCKCFYSKQLTNEN